MLTLYSRPLVLHVFTTAGALRAEGERNAVAMWDIHLAVGLEGNMTDASIAKDITKHTIASRTACFIW